MITKFDIYINEKINWGKIGDKADCFVDKISEFISWPIIKYTEKKVKNLSDEEKLIAIAKISNNIDKLFSPVKNLLFYTILASLAISKEIFISPVTYKEVYILFLVWILYTSLSKRYRLEAKSLYKKIKDFYVEKYFHEEKKEDPYGEEDWYNEMDIITKANQIRYNKKYKHTENIPFIGLRDKKDIEPA